MNFNEQNSGNFAFIMHFRLKNFNIMRYLKYYLLAFAVILLDQIVKLAVHEHMDMGRIGEIAVLGDWFKLHYTLNNGMAFGIKFDWNYGKLFLTLFRWFAMFGIGVYIYKLINNPKVHVGFIWCMALILGGAIGNVIDSTFYGILLDNSIPLENPPLFYPWFHGRVVDMFYFDIWQGIIPAWIPLAGGKFYSFWPIFNIADASIFIGVFVTIFRNKVFFPQEEETTNEDQTERETESMASNDKDNEASDNQNTQA